ncbi:hypothetical protein [Rhodoferax saidenbachensis]|uniref:Uncharacterized protein n=1 Tax=Rhodoferax saidenbachensis TaxID=1484693 RepID=A0A1P8KAP2_9BURK|nr:hypothetical protein [Rhodoferax saidenbachensis]APW43076.1 hypothetical protein RS694_11410 [Rhodoferax saidenbachensis]
MAILMGAVGAWAQEDAFQGLPSMAQERARIDTLRRQQTAEFNAQERACQDRFAVVRCTNDVNARRRAMQSELKRQEASLHDAERRQRGAEQLKRTEEKAVENAQRLSGMEPSGGSMTEEDRRKAQEDKVRQHAKPPATAASATPVEKSGGLEAGTAAANRADYVRKQEAALQRKKDREKRLQEKGASTAPLPAAP